MILFGRTLFAGPFLSGGRPQELSASAATAQVTATAALSSRVLLSGTAQVAVGVSGALRNTLKGSGTAAVAVTAQGDVSRDVTLSGGAICTVAADSGLSVAFYASGDALVGVTLSGGELGDGLFGVATVSVVASGQLTVRAPMQGSALCRGAASADLDVFKPFYALPAEVVGAAQASAVLTRQLTGQAQVGAQTRGFLQIGEIESAPTDRIATYVLAPRQVVFVAQERVVYPAFAERQVVVQEYRNAVL